MKQTEIRSCYVCSWIFGRVCRIYHRNGRCMWGSKQECFHTGLIFGDYGQWHWWPPPISWHHGSRTQTFDTANAKVHYFTWYWASSIHLHSSHPTSWIL